ncbi:MAG: hypothetical protein R3208_15590 [Ketobacteraceae bacterium]|nr:hypothetical protein [Ketobacteraceae bacterium]
MSSQRVAYVFVRCFDSDEFKGYFDRVVFAVMHDEDTRDNHEAFHSRFAYYA